MMTFSHPRTGRWLTRAVALAAIGMSLYLDLGAMFVVPILFVLVVPFEKMFPRHRSQRIRRPHAALDVSYALASPAMNAIGIGVAIVVGLVSLAWLPGLLIRPLVGMLPPAVLPFVGIALFDMAIYWVHRWSHEVPALWRFHSVHHSTEHLDWVSGFRNHPFDGAIVAPPFFFLIAAGFDATFTGALAVIQLVLGLFLHANVRWRLRPLHRLLITPEFHHWHHADEIEAHNSNYSVFLPLWDLMFGTYYMPRNKRPIRYGVSEDMPMTMAGQLRYPFHDVRSPRQMIRHPWRSSGAGWRTVRRTVAGVRRSTFRPRTVRPRPGEPCTWATNPPRRSPGGFEPCVPTEARTSG
jgi:sterol desaturase/sphingolipid hydroxylase (fatty acid hydroxylase superfamily)